MSRLLVALALVLAACTAPVEPADPVEACVEAEERWLRWICDECGTCHDVDLRADLRAECEAEPDAREVARERHCQVDCLEAAVARGDAACPGTGMLRPAEVEACLRDCSE